MIDDKQTDLIALKRILVKEHPLATTQARFFPASHTIQDMVDQCNLGQEVIVLLGGNELPQHTWKHTRVKPYAHVVIAPRATGGGGGGGKKGVGDWLKIIAIVIVAVVLTVALGPGSVPVLGLMVPSSLIVGLACAAVWMLLNLAFPPPKAKTPGAQGELDSQTYNLSAQSNDPKPYAPVIKVYGRHKLFPPAAAQPYAVWHGDRNDLYLLFDLGFGTYELENTTLADTGKNTQGQGYLGETPIAAHMKTDLYWGLVVYNPEGVPATADTKAKTRARTVDAAGVHIFTAKEYGAIGNNIRLTANGTLTVQQIVDTWNSQNPTNTVTFSGGTGTDILAAEDISLTGGDDSVTTVWMAQETGYAHNNARVTFDGILTNEEIKKQNNDRPSHKIDYDGPAEALSSAQVIKLTGGSPTGSPEIFKYYKNDMEGENFGLKLEPGMENVRYSSDFASEIQVDINFPQGLWSANDKGDKGPAWVDYEIFLGEVPPPGGVASSGVALWGTRATANHAGIVSFFSEKTGTIGNGLVIAFRAGQVAKDVVVQYNIDHPDTPILITGNPNYVMPTIDITLSGATTGQVTFAATTSGPEGNITLPFDGKTTIADFVSDWNADVSNTIKIQHNATNPSVAIPDAQDLELSGGIAPDVVYKDLTEVAFSSYGGPASSDIRIPMAVRATTYRTNYIYAPLPNEFVDNQFTHYQTRSRYKIEGDGSRIYDYKTGQWSTRAPVDLVATYVIPAGTTKLICTGGVPTVGAAFDVTHYIPYQRYIGGYPARYQTNYNAITTKHAVTEVSGKEITVTPAFVAEQNLGAVSLHGVQQTEKNVTTEPLFYNYVQDNLSKYTLSLNAFLEKKRFRITAIFQNPLTYTMYFPNLKSQTSTEGSAPKYAKYAVKLVLISKGAAYGTMIQNDSAWVQIRTVRSSIPPVNPKIQHTFVEMYARANERLNQAINNYNLVLTSILPICMDIDEWDDKSKWENKPSRNPAWIFVDVLSGIGAKAPIPVTLLDKHSIMKWAAFCAEELPKYGGPRYTCDFVLDFNSPTRELLDKICSAGRAGVAIIEGKYGVIIDEIKDIPVQIFTPRNYKNLVTSRNYVKQPHGMKVKWVDPMREWELQEDIVLNDGYVIGEGPLWAANTKYYEKEVVTSDHTYVKELYQVIVAHTSSSSFMLDEDKWKLVKVAERFESLDTFGCTRIDQAVRFGRYFLAQMKLRQDTITFETDIENLVSSRGDRVQLVADTIRVGGKVARIVKKAADFVTIDDRFELGALEAGQSYAFEVRGPKGIFKGESVQAATSTGYDWKIGNFTDGTFADIGLDDILIVGIKGYTTFDCIIKEIRPTKNYGASVSLQEYAPEIFAAADGGEIDTYDPRITPLSQNLKPVKVNNVTLDETIFFRDGQAFSRISILIGVPENSVYGALNIHMDSTEIDNLFTPEYKLLIALTNAISQYTVEFPASRLFQNIVKDKTVRFKVQPVNINGAFDALDLLTEYSIKLHGDITLPANVTSLDLNVDSISSMSAHWEIPNPPEDLAGFRIRYSPDVAAMNWNEVAPFINFLPPDARTYRFQARVGTYMIKTIDSSGNSSEWPVIAVTSIPSISGVELLHGYSPESPTGDWTRYPPTGTNARPYLYVETDVVDYVVPTGIANKAAIKNYFSKIARFRKRLRGPKSGENRKALTLTAGYTANDTSEGYFYFSSSFVLKDVYTLRVSNLGKGFGRSPGIPLKEWPMLKDVGPINVATDDGWGMALETKLAKDAISLSQWPPFNSTTGAVTVAQATASHEGAVFTAVPIGNAGNGIVIAITGGNVQSPADVVTASGGKLTVTGGPATFTAATNLTTTNGHNAVDSGVTVPAGQVWANLPLNEISGDWTEWKVVHAGEYAARMFQFRYKLSSYTKNVTPILVSGNVRLDMPERLESKQNLVTNNAGYKVVTYESPFIVYGDSDLETAVAIAIGVDAIDDGLGGFTSGGATYKIMERSAYGFKIQFYNSDGTILSKVVQFDYMAKGFGKTSIDVT